MNDTEMTTIVVAGDVCIDWLSIPIEPVAVEGSGSAPANWQLRGGRHMYSRRGGAWLTADFTLHAVRGRARVCKPEEREPLASIPPDELIHSMLMLDSFPRERDKKAAYVWGVRKAEGFAGPGDGKLLKEPPRAQCDDPNVAIVVLDDAGNGFRDDPALWPEALQSDKKPIVIHKIRRPLFEGPMWDCLRNGHLDRTIAVLNANELRAVGVPISRQLSWERTAADLVLSLEHEPAWEPLRKCAHIVVPFGLEGVVHLFHPNDQAAARLWYVPGLIENDLLNSGLGEMAGFSSAFTAALAAEIAACPPQERLSAATIYEGIEKGIVASRYLLDRAFGDCKDKQGKPLEPNYPGAGIFDQSEFPGFKVYHVDLPQVPKRSDLSGVGKFCDWRILDLLRDKPIRELATNVALHGLNEAMPNLPVAKFGGLETIDRWEIESYRSIRNLVREFIKNPKAG